MKHPLRGVARPFPRYALRAVGGRCRQRGAAALAQQVACGAMDH
ncbi:hypothetical protein [Paenacidovorax caeni]|nr:hypothetical protein [Paenacidovorax caeni]